MIDFPDNPTDGQTHSEAGVTWQWRATPGLWAVLATDIAPNEFVRSTGDTMTGALTMISSDIVLNRGTLALDAALDDSSGYIQFREGGVTRVQLAWDRFSGRVNERFVVQNYDGTGTFINTGLEVSNDGDLYSRHLYSRATNPDTPSLVFEHDGVNRVAQKFAPNATENLSTWSVDMYDSGEQLVGSAITAQQDLHVTFAQPIRGPGSDQAGQVYTGLGGSGEFYDVSLLNLAVINQGPTNVAFQAYNSVRGAYGWCFFDIWTAATLRADGTPVMPGDDDYDLQAQLDQIDPDLLPRRSLRQTEDLLDALISRADAAGL